MGGSVGNHFIRLRLAVLSSPRLVYCAIRYLNLNKDDIDVCTIPLSPLLCKTSSLDVKQSFDF